MADALTALEHVSTGVSELADFIASLRGKTVNVAVTKSTVAPTVKDISLTYFESVRAELDLVKERAAQVDEIDWVMQTLLSLSSAPREKSAYLGVLNEARPYLVNATVTLMKGRGQARLVLSRLEKGIVDTMGTWLPASAISYEQVLRDIAEGKRVSWRGPATELREVLREVMDHFAPDAEVMAVEGFQLEQGQTRPTQKQKVRFIMKARRRKSAAVTVAEESLEAFESGIAALARATYTLGAAGTHAPTDATEFRNLKTHVDALLADLLQVP